MKLEFLIAAGEHLGVVCSVEAWEHTLFELCTLRDHKPLGDWVIEDPAMVVWRVANKNALLHVWLQLLALVFLHKDISRAPKHSEATERYLASCPTRPQMESSLAGKLWASSSTP